MIANYHTHTPRCRHAVGSEREYVQAALDNGIQILGFSDHTPYFFPGDYYSTMRMFPQQLSEYAETVQLLQKENEGKLQIHLGLEAEYYPDYFGQLLPFLKDHGIEYLLLGQHWPGNEIDEPYCGRPTREERHLQRYCDQVIDAMYTGYFSYLAHPDLLNFIGAEGIYEKHMRRICKAAKECGMPLEVNMLGLRCGRHYPDVRFWRLAAEENCAVVIGCDAHEPSGLNDKANELRAMEIVREYGLQLLPTVPLRRL